MEAHQKVVLADYFRRWQDLAQWAVCREHGAAAKFSLTFAFALRSAAAADSHRITWLRPRVWHVVAGPLAEQFQRVSFFDDSLTSALLQTVSNTDGFPTPIFPCVPCGSQNAEVWAHSLASRKISKKEKNFVALCNTFGVRPATTERWNPLDIHLASAAVFKRLLNIPAGQADELVTRQLGVASPMRAHYACQKLPGFDQPGDCMGTVRITSDGGTEFDQECCA